MALPISLHYRMSHHKGIAHQMPDTVHMTKEEKRREEKK